MTQLDMFGAGPRAPVAPAEVDDDLLRLGAALPPTVRFGTSSWTFPGWAGLVYRDRASEPTLGLMPTIPDAATQARITGDTSALVIRWMLAPHHDYESAGLAYAPFATLRDPDPRTRRAVVELIRRATARDVPALVIVNNNAEGSSPRSIAALARELVDGERLAV